MEAANKEQSPNEKLIDELSALWRLIPTDAQVTRRKVYEVLNAASYWLQAAEAGGALCDEVWTFIEAVDGRDHERMPGEVAHGFFAFIKWRLRDPEFCVGDSAPHELAS